MASGLSAGDEEKQVNTVILLGWGDRSGICSVDATEPTKELCGSSRYIRKGSMGLKESYF